MLYHVDTHHQIPRQELFEAWRRALGRRWRLCWCWRWPCWRRPWPMGRPAFHDNEPSFGTDKEDTNLSLARSLFFINVSRFRENYKKWLRIHFSKMFFLKRLFTYLYYSLFNPHSYPSLCQLWVTNANGPSILRWHSHSLNNQICARHPHCPLDRKWVC